MDKELKRLIKNRKKIEEQIDKRMSEILKNKIDSLTKKTKKKWEFLSGMGVYYFQCDGKQVDDDNYQVKSTIDQIDELGEAFRGCGWFYPSFNYQLDKDRE